MKGFWKSVGFKALAGVALFLMGIMIYAASTGGFATIPAAITGAIVTPIQSALAALSDGVSSFFSGLTSGSQLQQQLEEQNDTINSLRQQLVEFDEIKRQNELYKQFLELKEAHPDYQFADGRVIAIDPSDKYGNFTINTGSLGGVSPDDPVITPPGWWGWSMRWGPTGPRSGPFWILPPRSAPTSDGTGTAASPGLRSPGPGGAHGAWTCFPGKPARRWGITR